MPSLKLRLPEKAPPGWPSEDRGRLHHESVTARLGAAIGIALITCFVTGVLSHYNHQPWGWLPPPATPAGGYRFTQGLHVITGFALIPLLLAKLWSVQHKLGQWPPARSVLHALERGSVGVLIASAILQLVTGVLNTLQYYPWKWSFVGVHYALSWILIGSLLVHIAVQLPVIRRGLGTKLGKQFIDDEGLTRRGAVTAIGVGVGVVGITTVGQVVGPLAKVALLAPRRPDQAPSQDMPVNRSAAQSSVRREDITGKYELTLKGSTTRIMQLADIEALPTQTRNLSIACVEGWSRRGVWTGPRLLDVVRMVGGNEDSVVTLLSFQKVGYRKVVRTGVMQEALLATHLNGERISLDHGYPLRLIAPDVQGETQVKWIGRIEVSNG